MINNRTNCIERYRSGAPFYADYKNYGDRLLDWIEARRGDETLFLLKCETDADKNYIVRYASDDQQFYAALQKYGRLPTGSPVLRRSSTLRNISVERSERGDKISVTCSQLISNIWVYRDENGTLPPSIRQSDFRRAEGMDYGWERVTQEYTIVALPNTWRTSLRESAARARQQCAEFFTLHERNAACYGWQTAEDAMTVEARRVCRLADALTTPADAAPLSAPKLPSPPTEINPAPVGYNVQYSRSKQDWYAQYCRTFLKRFPTRQQSDEWIAQTARPGNIIQQAA